MSVGKAEGREAGYQRRQIMKRSMDFYLMVRNTATLCRVVSLRPTFTENTV